jgi:hypothetical protein
MDGINFDPWLALLAETNSGAAAVLVDELNAGRHELLAGLASVQ